MSTGRISFLDLKARRRESRSHEGWEPSHLGSVLDGERRVSDE